MDIKANNIYAVVTSSSKFLTLLVDRYHESTDSMFQKGTDKAPTLNDYNGSIFKLPIGNSFIEVLVINPLENLLTVSHAMPASKRFLQKLLDKDTFYKSTTFTWDVVESSTENSQVKLQALLERFQSARLIAIDIETKRDDPLRRMICVGYCAYFEESHTSHTVVIPVEDVISLDWIRKFNKSNPPKIFQGGLFDNVYLMRWGCPVHNWLHDTMILFHCMFSEFPKRLDFIASYAMRDSMFWKDSGKSGNIKEFYRYNALDCWVTLNSYLSLASIAQPYAIENYLMEFKLLFPAIHCELEGMKVDMPKLLEAKAAKEAEYKLETAKFQALINAPGFNVNSPKQVMNLMKVCGLNKLISSDAQSLLVAQASHPLNNLIFTKLQKLRKMGKLLSTYFVESKFWHGRCFYKLNPAGTDSGRMASSESSFNCGLQIQNIPRGKVVKQFLIADDGWVLAEIDKAQSEARCVAYLSGETALIDLVESKHDYHSWNAAAFFGIPYEQIWDEELGKVLLPEIRQLSKNTNHGKNYNMGATVMLATMGPDKVAKAKTSLKLPARMSLKQVCQFLLDAYDRRYPNISGQWYSSIIKSIEMTGKLVSSLGWTRVFFNRTSLRTNKSHLNEAVAHPAQNLSVSIINIEFYNVWRASVYGSYYKGDKLIECDLVGKLRLKAQIHDSILFQYKIDSPEVPDIVFNIMDTTVDVVDAVGVTRKMFIPSDMNKGGKSWSDLK
jgi:DNA polymerase I-like protein with 3'-5' exonuclease and polymerase domains